MSSNPERKSEDEEEGTVIPVFTVIKNGVILKNIFIVNNPPSPVSGLSSIKFVQNSENSNQDTKEILIVGRHPDCNVVLMHPSISRFHLQIDSNPSLQKLFVTDLSSVHGTWISEKKIDPGFRVELKEGDTIRMGTSTRVYRLHWVPLCRAYDLENPFVSESDLAFFKEKEEENVDKMSENEDLLATENKNVEEKDSLAVLGKAEDSNQAIDSFDSEKAESQSVYSTSEHDVSSFSDEISGLIIKKEIPSPKSVEKEETEISFRNDHELSLKSVGGVILQTLSAIFYDCNQSPEYLFAEEDVDISMMTRLELESRAEVSSDSPSSITEVDSASKMTEETTCQILLRKENEQKVDIHLPLQSVHLSMPPAELSNTNNEYVNKENQTPVDLPASDPLSEEGNIRSTTDDQQLNDLLNLQNNSDDADATGVLEETKNQSPMRKEGILRAATIYDPASIQVLEETEDRCPLSQERTLNEPAIDDPAAIEVFEEAENQSPSTKEGLLREPTTHEPAANGILGETEDQGTIRKESILNEPTNDNPAAVEVSGGTENQSSSTKEGILREPTIDDPTAIGVYGEAEDWSPSRKEGMPREPTIDGPAAIEVLEETEDQSPLIKESLLTEAILNNPASIEVLEETEDPSPFRQKRTLDEPAIDDPAAVEVFGETENQTPSAKEGLLIEPPIHKPAAIRVLGETEGQGTTVRKESILNEPSNENPAAVEVFGETENQSPSTKEGLLREPRIDDPTAIGVLGEAEDQSPLRKEGMPREPTIDGPAVIGVLEETEDWRPLMEESLLTEAILDNPAATGVIGVTEYWSPLRKEGMLRKITIDDPSASEVLKEAEDWSPLRKECILNEPTVDDPAPTQVSREAENQSPSTKEGKLREPTIVSTAYLGGESPNSFMPHGEVIPQSKQCQTPQSNVPEIENSKSIIGLCDRSEKRTGSCNIWSRRGKPASALQLQTNRSQRKTKGDEEIDGAAEWENQENVERESIRKALFSDLVGMAEEIYTPEKENRTPNTSVQRSLKKNIESKSTTRALFSNLDAMDDEKFTPNKENRTPNTSILRSKKKSITELEDNTARALFSNLDAMDDESFTPNKENRIRKSSIPRSKKKPIIELENNIITSSDIENQTPQILREMKSARFSSHRFKLDEDIVLKERRAERVPLQSLISNSPISLSDASFPSSAKRSSSSITCHQKKMNSVGDGRRRWTMIADTTSLLNKEMRNALQLLQGLKGTQLIIPRIVIRELDSLKRCNSLFRRKTEASVVLEWIEECMMKTKWWIHVQNSVEEVRPIAPTPPATPVSQLHEGCEVFPFSAHGTPVGLVSPTTEDHILDCALLYRKTNNDRQLALLSNNMTLRIKAMAEGLICETPQEFRDSLVNPFSDRFLWADSSPRGQTWSVFDDVVLKEKYYRSPSKKSSRREVAKGLKLILLQNPHYVKTV